MALGYTGMSPFAQACEDVAEDLYESRYDDLSASQRQKVRAYVYKEQDNGK